MVALKLASSLSMDFYSLQLDAWYSFYRIKNHLLVSDWSLLHYCIYLSFLYRRSRYYVCIQRYFFPISPFCTRDLWAPIAQRKVNLLAVIHNPLLDYLLFCQIRLLLLLLLLFLRVECFVLDGMSFLFFL